jgi:hypothetical protein
VYAALSQAAVDLAADTQVLDEVFAELSTHSETFESAMQEFQTKYGSTPRQG